ncbi:MAG: lipid A-modifier LpxR family protein [Usitatibacter sp.]
MRPAAAALALLAASAGATAGEAHWYAQVANDVAFGTDRWYTSGVRIAREKDGVEWGIVQDVYTPDAKHWHAGVDDRAPAARLLLSGALHQRTESLFQTFEIAAGVTGPSALGEEATSAVHRLVPAPHVEWDRQGADELDAQAVVARTHWLAPGFLQVHYGATLGTHLTFAHAGFEVRGGNAAISSALLRFAPTPPVAARGDDARSWSAYLGMSARLIAKNEFLVRNYDPFGADLSYRRSVTRLAAGASYIAGWGTVTFEAAQDSKEFDAQAAPHRFGSLSVQFPF